ncbi:hypothetical protein CEXT_466791 [Caerostris extrusa]|uniref:Uncharacterized protein n=1 Tax=Caerostris extrusa TaxID=172846 RepID=A0AAV4TSQ4_CAEEX|nr:hypothetical protein CEXT_466791 [Caerostris extrusa]
MITIINCQPPRNYEALQNALSCESPINERLAEWRLRRSLQLLQMDGDDPGQGWKHSDGYDYHHQLSAPRNYEVAERFKLRITKNIRTIKERLAEWRLRRSLQLLQMDGDDPGPGYEERKFL